jgi:class 3 adenylate cyclase/CheY-like chemotaxis protein
MAGRALTLPFSDIARSTELLAKLDERRSARLRHLHLDAMRHETERHGGRVVKNLGDGVMATFDAARAGIECGVAMQRTAAQGPPDGEGQPLSIRIGMSSGDVHVEGGDCFGNAVIEASRLCAHATGGQVLVAESTRLLARSYKPLSAIGQLDLKGLPEPTTAWAADWSIERKGRIRVVLADDAVLVREGIARVLEERGIDVLAQAGDAAELIRATATLRPDLAIIDLRMPPTRTDEGLKAAEALLAQHPRTGVLILSQDIEPHYAERLRSARQTGVGYLLKERVSDTREFADAVRHIATGGTAFEPDLLATESAR